MAATTQATPGGECHDSNHQSHPSSSKLEDHAATAALYVTRDRQNKTGREHLDKDQKLSSASAAASLKYANSQDLPSYPISGLKKNDSAAGAAATLGWANQKTFQHWKPDPSASAAAAATVAKDYKMAPLWQPEQSTNGAKAAVLAARDGGKVEIWQPEANSPWGNSAATRAFKKFGAGGLSPVLDYGYTDVGRKGSLLAATGAMSNGRRRAQSELVPPPTVKPETYPDESNATSNALRAATSAHKQGKRSDNQIEGGSSPITNMGRAMYSSHPPVALEVDEKKRQDTLHASAIAMAQGMYQQQQTQFAAASQHAQRGAMAAHHGRHASGSSISTDEAPHMRFTSLQEAAQKLAQERLAKLHDEHAKNREYRDYYGGKEKDVPPPVYKAQNRLSIRGRARRRASSDGDVDVDREQSDKIRQQMSIFSNTLSQVDEKKRAKDRENLIAAAQRNVTKSLHGMDEKVFAETGKVAPSLLSEWEVKAHAAAQRNSEARMENHGMIHIGGGKFVSQSEIDGVAARNVQPVLDEINEKAATERERVAAVKLEQETTARKEADLKAREKEKKQIDKKLKQQDKEEEKMRKAEEKAARKEEERAAKEKRKSARAEAAVVVPTAATEAEPIGNTTTVTAGSPAEESAPTSPETTAQAQETTTEAQETAPPPVEPKPAALRTSMEDQSSLRMREVADAANADESTPASPSKMKSWLKSKFSRRQSKGSGSKSSDAKDTPKEETSSFVGGAALTGASVNDSTASIGHASGSMRDVALAKPDLGPDFEKTVNEPEVEKAITDAPETEPEPEPEAEAEPSTTAEQEARAVASEEVDAAPEVSDEEEEERVGRSKRRESEVSAVSKEGAPVDEEFQEARDNFDEDLIPPPTFPVEKSASPVRDSKFKEEM